MKSELNPTKEQLLRTDSAAIENSRLEKYSCFDSRNSRRNSYEREQAVKLLENHWTKSYSKLVKKI